jgi:hypothetical protein
MSDKKRAPWHVSPEAFASLVVGPQDPEFRAAARKLVERLGRGVSAKETRLYLRWRAKNVKRAQKFWAAYVPPAPPPTE